MQPEILLKRPNYFEEYMRWVFRHESDDNYYILTNKDCCNYIAGDKIGKKQNNFKQKLFNDITPLSEDEFVNYVSYWIKSS